MVKRISVDDYYYADGYDVLVQNERDDTWQSYVIAMDGYRMVRVDIADSEHLTMPETKREADGESAEWAGNYLYYDGVIWEDGRLYHRLYLVMDGEQGWEKRKFLLDDATGELYD